jgi:hypothetical protein
LEFFSFFRWVLAGIAKESILLSAREFFIHLAAAQGGV